MKPAGIAMAVVAAALALAPATTEALTVKEFVIRLNDPKTRLATEEYAVAVGQGFFWYFQAVAERGIANGNVLCFRENVTLGRAIILQAANRAVDNSISNTSFEKALLQAFTDLFPCP
mgnify:CR=1 FL=1